jgi:ribosomal protein L32
MEMLVRPKSAPRAMAALIFAERAVKRAPSWTAVVMARAGEVKREHPICGALWFTGALDRSVSPQRKLSTVQRRQRRCHRAPGRRFERRCIPR